MTTTKNYLEFLRIFFASLLKTEKVTSRDGLPPIATYRVATENEKKAASIILKLSEIRNVAGEEAQDSIRTNREELKKLFDGDEADFQWLSIRRWEKPGIMKSWLSSHGLM